MAKRDQIYYWKCDRPSAFFAINGAGVQEKPKIDALVLEVCSSFFKSPKFVLNPGSGQGNHLTYRADYKGEKYFLRIENGPDEDDYMEVEAEIMRRLNRWNIPTPLVYEVDASRSRYPFAYQIMENLEWKDLNELNRIGKLNLPQILSQLGRDMATWQNVFVEGYGPFDVEELRIRNKLKGIHPDYLAYYSLNLEKHLAFLNQNAFISLEEVDDILNLIRQNTSFLKLTHPCLVHKDMALWNLLGDENTIKSYIDWDDAIAGDPTDDIALMGCFFSGKQLQPLIRGYQTIRPLPPDFEIRFWLHLLRNMIFKAVIRVGAGYFERGSNFYLLGSVQNNKSLEQITIQKIQAAREGLRQHLPITTLL